jgi:hypothetical protein
MLDRWRHGVLRVWRGDIGLYRAAYGLGGLGFAIVSLFADLVIDMSASTGGWIGWLSFTAAALGEIAFAWLCIVATWRSVQGRRAAGRAYGRVAVSLALMFVWFQLVITAGWICWSSLAGLGLASKPTDIVQRIELRLTETIADPGR